MGHTMQTRSRKRPPLTDERRVENGIEEGHVRRKGRFDKVISTSDDEDDEDMAGEYVDAGDGVNEDAVDEGHVEREGRSGKVVSTDPFDLPDEIVLQIFKTGTSLHLAEQVSEKWRSKIESTPEFWKNACNRLSLNENNITQLLRRRLEVKRKKSKYSNKALVWRDIWLKYRTRVCQRCSSHKGSEYALFDGIVLCFPCKKLEPYNAVTLTYARRFFKIHTQTVQKKMKLADITLQSHTYDSPMGHEITLFKFTELAEMARIVKGKEAKIIVQKYRHFTGTKKMQDVHLREL